MINTFKVVYIDYSLRLVTQLIIVSVFVKKLSNIEFADFSFYLMLSGYIAVVINSGFDSLINRQLADHDKNEADDFYFQALKIKIALHLFLSIIFVCFMQTATLIPFLCLSLFGIILEHQDIKMRFTNNYKPVVWRIAATPLFFIGKVLACFNANINGFLLVTILETLYCILINYYYSPKLLIFGQESQFIRKYWHDFSKTILSGGLIFTYLQIDQFFIYAFLGKEVYSVYALATRFYTLGNNLVGIFARYRIPQLYLGESTYRQTLLKLYSAQAFFSIVVVAGLCLYVVFWVPNYFNSLYILAILIFCGFGLIFGQIKGVYFIKLNQLMPDIYNAIFGMIVFSLCYFCSHIQTGIGVAVCYLIGIIASGVISTFFYKTGREYFKLLIKD